MFDFLKKSFPSLKKESPYYVQALTGFIVKPHDEHEPLAGQDVFLGEFFVGQINRMPSSYDPPESSYYRGFYLDPCNNAKKLVVDELYAKVQKSVEDETNALYGQSALCMVDSDIVNEISEGMKHVKAVTDKFVKIKYIKVNKNEVAMQFFKELTDLIFINFQQLFIEMREKDIFPSVYLYYNDRQRNTIEIRTEKEGYPEKRYITRIYINDTMSRTMYATNRNWPEREIGKCAFSDDYEMYPVIEDIRSHYQNISNTKLSDDELKKAIINDITQHISKNIKNKIESCNWGISASEKQYNIPKDDEHGQEN